MAESIIITERSGRVARVTFNNPGVLNALTDEFIEEYKGLLEMFDSDESFDIVILTGSGKAFVAGADINSMIDLSPREAEQKAYETERLYLKMADMDKIFIAAVNGFALGGGCELALACDIRIASSKAKFGLPEVGLGILPGGGGTQRMQRIVGMGAAKELIFTAKHISADEAHRIGLVNKVVEPGELSDAADAMAAAILKNSMAAVMSGRKAINRGAGTDLLTGLAYEKAMFGMCFAHPDRKEGLSAFLEKRPPAFK
jgi:enoyl-CoA hydratase